MEVDDSRDSLDKKCEENDFEKKGSSDPVVYQLVRVEGDGTLVPATEDEVLQFEHFLQDEKVDIPSIEDVGHVEELFGTDCMVLNKSESEDDSFKLETAAVGTEKLCAGLEESILQSLDGSLSSPLTCTVARDQQPYKLHPEQGDNNIAHQENASTETAKSTVLNDSFIAEKDNTDACSRSADDLCTRQTDSQVTSSVPDFSILRGVVCLDDLTIRELQEAFRATFGRETNVKDKIWLKRRIAMGLANSCDVPSTGCVVKDFKIFDKDGKQVLQNTKERADVNPQAISLGSDQVKPPVNERSSPSSSYYQSEDQQGSSKRLKRVPITKAEPQSNNLAEQCLIKRIRKPTKRFIEELSDSEARDSTEKLSLPAKRVARDEELLKPWVTPFHDVDSLRMTYPTRKDILGGFSVHVPYVSRIRRGRPRKDFISFVDNIPSVVCKEAQTTVGVENEGKEGKYMRKVFEAPPMVNSVKGAHIEAVDKQGIQKLQANGYNAAAKPKINRAFTRKHHRPWTLCEVMKLVDGVALYGAGKWSEIRKAAFSSYSYRTSVDLKDKWRNLIRASKSQLPALDGGCPRKTNPSIIPIPPSILLRVKELNELQSEGGGFTVTAAVKFSGSNSRIVQGKGSGFL